MSQFFVQSSGGGGSGNIMTITGNTGGPESPTANNFNFVTANSTVIFAGSTSTETVDFGGGASSNLVLGTSLPSLTSASFSTGLGSFVLGSLTSGASNTALGTGALATASTSSSNTACGASCLTALTTSIGRNTGLGVFSLDSILTGTMNLGLGYQSGHNYTSSESHNVVIAHEGVTGESHVLRVGTQGSGVGQQNVCFIAGIIGVTNSNPEVVTINSSTGQVGIDATNFQILSTGLQLKGNNTNTTPPAGFIGEQIRATVAAGSAVSLSNSTTANVTSISLTPGIWDVTGMVGYVVAGSTVVSFLLMGISTTSATLAGNYGDDTVSYDGGAGGTTGIAIPLDVPALRMTIASTTTVYLVTEAVFSVSTVAAYGRISATRVG